jgi:hypothetical protein
MKPKTKDKLESEFRALVEKHGAEIKECFNRAKKLADKHGIPFGNYVPQKYVNTFICTGYDKNTYEEHPRLSVDETLDILQEAKIDIDYEYWQSSTTECEVLHGG